MKKKKFKGLDNLKSRYAFRFIAPWIVGMIFFPIWWVCLAISIVAVGTAANMFAKDVKETKGANLDEIE